MKENQNGATLYEGIIISSHQNRINNGFNLGQMRHNSLLPLYSAVVFKIRPPRGVAHFRFIFLRIWQISGSKFHVYNDTSFYMELSVA